SQTHHACQYQLQKHNKLVVFFTNQPLDAQIRLQSRAKSIAQHFRCVTLHGGSMKPTDTDTDVLGRRSFTLQVPGVGEITARMSPAQALRFIADCEQQLNALVPRSLRTEPISITEIDTLEALQAASYALRRALNNSATSATLANALNAVEAVLNAREAQP
ncbi:MAG: hypothetical protein EBT07_17750, partial [Actinobacteria bacterium]|nr:hypothetical protein [Actinomycetota bacterium]